MPDLAHVLGQIQSNCTHIYTRPCTYGSCVFNISGIDGHCTDIVLLCRVCM